MIRYLLKLAGRVVSFLFGTSLLLVIVFRFLPVPFTSMMAIRAWEQYSSGKPIHVQQEWVGMDKISPQMPAAVIASEDQLFYEHYGFDFNSIEKAALQNRSARTKRGASTLTQQVAKNLFLWPGRDWLRKGLEAYFTLLLELVWSKERILEVYLNIAETGNGIFGVEAAAQRYFDKPAAKLSLRQAALIAAALPNPRKWSPATPNRYLKTRSAWIVKTVELKRSEDELRQLAGEEGLEEANTRGRRIRLGKKPKPDSAEGGASDDGGSSGSDTEAVETSTRTAGPPPEPDSAEAADLPDDGG